MCGVFIPNIEMPNYSGSNAGHIKFYRGMRSFPYLNSRNARRQYYYTRFSFEQRELAGTLICFIRSAGEWHLRQKKNLTKSEFASEP